MRLQHVLGRRNDYLYLDPLSGPEAPSSCIEMSLQVEETVPAGGSRRVLKAAKWVPLVGKGVGRALWRAVRRSSRQARNRGHGHHAAGASLIEDSQTDPATPGIPFWAAPTAPIWDLSTELVLAVPGPPSWLPAPLQQLLWPAASWPAGLNCITAADRQTPTTAAATAASAAHGAHSSSRAGRRRERRAARQQRRAQRRLQKQLSKVERAQVRGNSSSSCGGNNTLANDASVVAAASSASGSGAAGGWATHVLAQMINPANTFPMLLHSAQHIAAQQQDSTQQQPEGADVGYLSTSCTGVPQDSSSWGASSSSSGNASRMQRRPQQLLTVGCRHWGNGMVQGLGLKVKIYDFAIYLDGQQAQAHLPTTSLQLEDSPDSNQASLYPGRQQQQQQQQQLQQQVALAGQDSSSHDLPAVLKSARTAVEMSLVLKAARDVPLHLLSAEYEKVLRRRLDRVGGNPADVAALQQLLASFSDASRLPAAVTAGGNSSSSGSSSSEPELPGGAGGSVRKGAMIVFERSAAGDVTARVGPVVLGTVSSPKVAEALFDLYLGEQPVSKTAKEAAGQTLLRIAATSPPAGLAAAASPAHSSVQDAGNSTPQQLLQLPAYYLPSSKGQEIQCEGRSAVGGRRQKRGADSGSGGAGPGAAAAAVLQGLHVDDLDACVLHLG